MIRAIIVDDEEWVSIGFKLQIRMDVLNMELAGTAINGDEAIELIENVSPDIVITDIQMPGMDGIKLMDYLYKRYPEIRIIVISGYSEFEYARKAIAYNAVNYILKPIDWLEMQNTLRQVIEEIEKNRNKKKEEILIRNELNEHKLVYNGKLLTDLVTKQEMDSARISETLKKVKLGFDCELLAILVIRIYHFSKQWEEETEGLLGSLDDVCYSIQGKIEEKYTDTIVFESYAKKNEIIVLRGFEEYDDTDNFLFEELNDMALLIQNAVESGYPFRVSIGAGKAVSLELINQSYLQAIESVKYAGFSCNDAIVHYDELSNYSSYSVPSDKEKEFLFYLEKGKLEKVNGLINEIFLEVSGKNFNPQSFKNSILELIVSMGRLMRGYDNLLHDITESDDTYRIIFEDCSMEELKNWFQAICLQVIACIASKNKSSGEKIVDEIISYLEDHYSENVNLNSIADKYFFTAAYISKIFKSHTDINFSEYLCRLRIMKAAELLKEPGLKLNDIAEIVGYENSNYFFKKFKDHFGCTPSEYKRRV